MRRVLIVSPHFPPTNAPDAQRVRMSLPYFAENGWEAVVLAVDTTQVEAPQDPLLGATIPAGLTVVRVGALPSALTRLLGLGNIAYRAWSRLNAAGDRLLREQQFDLVYFSTTQFVATALGRRWLRRHGVPFVVDIQDPWRTDYYERPGSPPPPGGWKYRFARWQAARLEERSWREAAGFVSVSEDYLTQLRQRYAWFGARPAAFIPFGAPEADFDFVRTQADVTPAFVREPGKVHLVSVGVVGPIMRTALELLFAGVRNLRTLDPAAAARLRLHFIGTSYAPAGLARDSVRPVAQACGVADVVHEQPARTGYFSGIATLLAADALVILGSDEPAYNPSKIATCYLAARPAIALTPAGSALDRMVRALDFATLATWPATDGVSCVTDFLRQQTQPAGAAPRARAEAVFAATHTARARTRQQCALFDQALAAPR